MSIVAYNKSMTNTNKSYAILVSYKAGAFWATPESSIEAGLLNGMVEASAWASQKLSDSIAWTEVTDRFVKGHFVRSGERIIVLWGDLPMRAEEELTNWLYEEVSA